MVAFAGMMFAIIIIIIVLFQMGLAIGMPWGEYVMGGYSPGRFPWKLRLLAIVQGILLIIFAVIVLDKADLFRFKYVSIPSIAIWFPASILLLISSLIVALY